ncbi:hypothetical protein LZ31DRAFT_589658 [Colletotrichum somersetense]|nr:hypothetical protein LZ31DRAFT_589658 [Colletotrichum somersetense]
MDPNDSNSSLRCQMPGCKPTPFASVQNLVRHWIAIHGAPVNMLCGKDMQNVPYNYRRHLFGCCYVCKDILRVLAGGEDPRVRFKATSLDTLHHMHQEMLHQKILLSAQDPCVTWTGVGPKDEHGEYQAAGGSTTSASQPLEHSSSFEMFTDLPCVCPEFNPSSKSGVIAGTIHQTFVQLDHPIFGYTPAGNMSTDLQQETEMPACFKNTLEAFEQGQIRFHPTEGNYILDGTAFDAQYLEQTME